MDNETKIITIRELIKNKETKERELEYYRSRLEFLQNRVSLLEGDIRITNTIIKMIEEETLIEVRPE
jgi:hypothetical protein